MSAEAPAAAPAASLKGMSGVQKAAALLVAIGEQRASEIVRHLGETEVEALSLEIAKARKVPAEVCKEVVSEAVETVMAEEYIADGGVDFARSVLERSLGSTRAEEIWACPALMLSQLVSLPTRGGRRRTSVSPNPS